MSLTWILLMPLLGGLAAWISGRWSDLWPRWISLGTALLHMLLLLVTWGVFFAGIETGEGAWLMAYKQPWIPQLGISFHLAVDGLSLLLLLLTSFLTVLAVLTSWNSVTHSVGFFHFNLLLILTALSGVFIAFDLFLFFAFWEISLLPLYFLIGIWGYENRVYATTKFFIITQGSGLLMLLAILGLAVVHWQSTGILTFDYLELIGTSMSEATAFWLMLGFSSPLPSSCRWCRFTRGCRMPIRRRPPRAAWPWRAWCSRSGPTVCSGSWFRSSRRRPRTLRSSP